MTLCVTCIRLKDLFVQRPISGGVLSLMQPTAAASPACRNA